MTFSLAATYQEWLLFVKQCFKGYRGARTAFEFFNLRSFLCLVIWNRQSADFQAMSITDFLSSAITTNWPLVSLIPGRVTMLGLTLVSISTLSAISYIL
jgi:hypothetical protein